MGMAVVGVVVGGVEPCVASQRVRNVRFSSGQGRD